MNITNESINYFYIMTFIVEHLDFPGKIPPKSWYDYYGMLQKNSSPYTAIFFVTDKERNLRNEIEI